jgi:Reverse transcriptase (RNA-dependent DNA polymerase)
VEYVSLFNDILLTGKIPKLFKQAKVITISLLSVVLKLLERLILQRIEPLIDAVVPDSQAGFHLHRSCTEQVLALTSHIETGFERKLKTGTVYIDLTAAYDTVWRDGLMLKFIRVVQCAK